MDAAGALHGEATDAVVDEQTTIANLAESPSTNAPDFKNLIVQPSIQWDDVNWDRFSPKEQHILKHRMMQEKHRGHEMMHLEMLLIFFVAIIVAQALIVYWKLKHKKSFQVVTLLGLWIMPAGIAIGAYYNRMLIAWTFFTCVTCFVMYKATRRRITGNTPRLVYRWFLLVHRVTLVVGVTGYILLVFIFSGLIFVLGSNAQFFMELSLLLLFYGIYFGVLGRDCAELCVDYMAAAMKYTSSQSSEETMASGICAVCEGIISENEQGEKTYRLNCGHIFHEFCIRGWCIVGKKQICPYCKEKVDLKAIFKNPWEKPHILFGQMLDVVRYLVVWFPVISFTVQGIYYVLNLE